MNNALAYLGAFLAVVFAALFAAPALIDWNGYRGVFEEEASKLLGRDVRVGGDVNLRLLPTPYVKFEKVRLADVSGQTGEPFIRVENFMMRLSGPALLRGVLEATEIELNKPVLTLALDGAGGGNWGAISLQGASLPFAPRDVTLRSVKLIDGAISVYSPQSAVVARLDEINGELSADALRGPFRFKGAASWSGASREIRFATTEMSKDASFRLKAVSRAPATGNTVTLDALFDDVANKPKVEGALTGQVFGLGGSSATPPPNAPAGEVTAPMEFKSTLKADAGGASLSEITLTLQNAAEPQIITGQASAEWSGAPKLDLALNSKWLDLDRLVGDGEDSAPIGKVRELAIGVVEAVAGGGSAVAKIDVEQLKIGGETTGGLKVDAERKGGVIHLRQLRAGLPGGARLGLTGDIQTGEGGAAAFEGEAFISGTSLARLKTWAEKSGAKIDIGPEGVFTAEGKVRVGDRRFELTEASAQIGGRTMTGEIKFSEDGRRRADITVESAQLERNDLLPETTKALEAAVRKAFGFAPSRDAGDQPTDAALAKQDMDISLRVLAGELKRADQVLRDVDATVAIENGDVRIRSAKFSTAEGLAVSVEGRVDDKDGAPLGAVNFDAHAATPAAMRDLVRVFGLSEIVTAEKSENIGSARLAGILRLGSRRPNSADVSLAGMLGGSKVSAFGAFDDGLEQWRQGASRVSVAITAPAVSDLAVALTGVKVRQSPSQTVNFVLTTSGSLAAGASTRFDVTSDGLESAFEGALAWPDDRPIDVGGRIKIKAAELADALALAGLAQSNKIVATPVNGSIDVARKDGGWSLKSENLSLGASSLKGELAIAAAAGPGAPVSFKGNLSADMISVEGLLSPVVEPASAPPPVAAADGAASAVEDAPQTPAWPSGSFKLAALEKFQGEVNVAFSRLKVGDGLQVRAGQMTILKSPAKMEFKNIAGAVAGGVLSGDVGLETSAAGVKGAARISIRDVDLATLGAANAGKANIGVDVIGQAMSPSALIASLAGNGAVELKDARLTGPTHVAAALVVDAVLQAKIANGVEPVSTALQDEFSKSIVELGDRQIALAVTNGVVAIAPQTIDGAAGTTTAGASLDIGTWEISSVWKIAPRPTPLAPPGDSAPGSAASGLLPALSIAYTGPLDDFAALTPALEVTALQRELAVRQMERNVEELEQLRRADEERARQERERRKAMEEQKAREAAEAAARLQAEQAEQPPGPDANAPPGGPAPVTPNADGAPQSNAAPPAADPNAAPSADANANGDVTIDPPPAERPKPVYRPRQRPSEPRRTSSDEVMRSLGGFP